MHHIGRRVCHLLDPCRPAESQEYFEGDSEMKQSTHSMIRHIAFVGNCLPRLMGLLS